MAGPPLTSRVGQRGAVVIPVELRRRYGIEEGSLVIAEAHEQGVLIRPATAVPDDRAERDRILDDTATGYEALRSDPGASQRWRQETRPWEGSDGD